MKLHLQQKLKFFSSSDSFFTVNATVSFFPSAFVSSLQSVDHMHSVITFQPLFSADISVQLIMLTLPSRTGQRMRE